MTYYSTKTYGHNIGLSAVFRQPNADHSHCHLLHGYSLAFKFTFGCKDLDNKNWAVDFGGLKPLKAWLEDMFDHKLALDKNDPQLERLKELEKHDLALSTRALSSHIVSSRAPGAPHIKHFFCASLGREQQNMISH